MIPMNRGRSRRLCVLAIACAGLLTVAACS